MPIRPVRLLKGEPDRPYRLTGRYPASASQCREVSQEPGMLSDDERLVVRERVDAENVSSSSQAMVAAQL